MRRSDTGVSVPFRILFYRSFRSHYPGTTRHTTALSAATELTFLGRSVALMLPSTRRYAHLLFGLGCSMCSDDKATSLAIGMHPS